MTRGLRLSLIVFDSRFVESGRGRATLKSGCRCPQPVAVVAHSWQALSIVVKRCWLLTRTQVWCYCKENVCIAPILHLRGLCWFARAGRCQTGVCYHLFSRVRYNSMPEFQDPEILRHPLQVWAWTWDLLYDTLSAWGLINQCYRPDELVTNGYQILHY